MAIPIFLIIAASLAINYAVNPATPMIPMGAHFSLSLPLMVCSGLSLIFATVLGIQVVRRQAIRESAEKMIGGSVTSSESIQEKIREGFHPGGRKDGQTAQGYIKFIEPIKYTLSLNSWAMVEFKTRDEVTLRGFWTFKNNEAPTAIVFHGNAMQAEQMADSWGRYYKERGFNVLLVEYRGYGISDGTAAGPDQEMQAYLDAEASLKFVLSKGVDKSKVLAHGYSLGGAYAAALGSFYGVQHIVLNHTFTSGAAVAKNIVKKIDAPNLYGHAVIESYKQRRLDADPDIEDARPLITDGLNTLGKVKQMPGEIFVIRGKEDKLMHFEFGTHFVNAKYTDEDKRERRLVTIEGGHCDDHLFFTDLDALRALQDFLFERGLC